MTSPPPPDQHSHDEPREDDPADEAALALLAALIVAAAAAAALAALSGPAAVAGTAGAVIGAVTSSTRRVTGRIVVSPGDVDYDQQALDVLVGRGIPLAVARAIVRRFFRLPLPAERPPGSVGERQRREAAMWRARYLWAAAKRLREAIERARQQARATGEDEQAAVERAAREQLEREDRHAEAHRRAEAQRMDGADLLDEANRVHGPWLTWWAVLDHATTPECRTAHGHRFTIADPPPIGLPGTGPHARCRCLPVGPSWLLCPDGLTVAQALRTRPRHRHEEQ